MASAKITIRERMDADWTGGVTSLAKGLAVQESARSDEYFLYQRAASERPRIFSRSCFTGVNHAKGGKLRFKILRRALALETLTLQTS